MFKFTFKCFFKTFFETHSHLYLMNDQSKSYRLFRLWVLERVCWLEMTRQIFLSHWNVCLTKARGLFAHRELQRGGSMTGDQSKVGIFQPSARVGGAVEGNTKWLLFDWQLGAIRRIKEG